MWNNSSLIPRTEFIGFVWKKLPGSTPRLANPIADFCPSNGYQCFVASSGSRPGFRPAAKTAAWPVTKS